MTPAPGSAEDYFSILADGARRAGAAGDYAIAAAVVVRRAGRELVVLGVNRLFTERNPCGHAEATAIVATWRLTRLAPEQRADALRAGVQDGSLIVRDTAGADGLALYSTLEPCPMCTVCLLNAGIERVVIAAPDPPSGVLAPERLARLPEVWPRLAADVVVTWTQSRDPTDAETYLPDELREELVALFDASRENLDAVLLAGGVLDREALDGALASLGDDGSA